MLMAKTVVVVLATFATIPRNDDNEMNNSSTNDGQFPIANFNLKQLNFQR